MRKLLKWDFINYTKQSYSFYIVAIMIFAIMLVKRDYLGWLTSEEPIILVINLYLIFFGIIFTPVQAIRVMIEWTNRRSHVLEASIPIQTWKLFLSKLVLAATIIAFPFIFLIMFALPVLHFGADAFRNTVLSLVNYCFSILLACMIISFSYFTAKGFRITRRRPIIPTFLLSMGVYIANFYIIAGWIQGKKLTGKPAYDIVNDILQPGELTDAKYVFTILFSLAFFCILYLTNCRLYRVRFQKN